MKPEHCYSKNLKHRNLHDEKQNGNARCQTPGTRKEMALSYHEFETVDLQAKVLVPNISEAPHPDRDHTLTLKAAGTSQLQARPPLDKALLPVWPTLHRRSYEQHISAGLIPKPNLSEIYPISRIRLGEVPSRGAKESDPPR